MKKLLFEWWIISYDLLSCLGTHVGSLPSLPQNVWRVLIHRVVLLSSIKELWSDVLALYGQNQAKSRLDKEQQKLNQASTVAYGCP